MKKKLALILAAVILTGMFSACGGKNTSGADTSDSGISEVAAGVSATTASSSKICYTAPPVESYDADDIAEDGDADKTLSVEEDNPKPTTTAAQTTAAAQTSASTKTSTTAQTTTTAAQSTTTIATTVPPSTTATVASTTAATTAYSATQASTYPRPPVGTMKPIDPEATYGYNAHDYLD